MLTLFPQSCSFNHVGVERLWGFDMTDREYNIFRISSRREGGLNRHTSNDSRHPIPAHFHTPRETVSYNFSSQMEGKRRLCIRNVVLRFLHFSENRWFLDDDPLSEFQTRQKTVKICFVEIRLHNNQLS